MAEKRLDVHVAAHAKGFEAARQQVKALNNDLRGMGGGFGGGGGMLAGLGAAGGALLAVEKISAVTKQGAIGLREFAEGTITANQALAKALDPLPIIGSLDEIGTALGALIRMWDGSAEAAKKAAEEMARVKFNDDFRRMLDKGFAAAVTGPAKALREGGTPDELLKLRAGTAEARRQFALRFGVDVDAFDPTAAMPDVGKPEFFRMFGDPVRRREAEQAQQDIRLMQQRMRDMEADEEMKRIRAAQSPGMLGGLRGMAGDLFGRARGAVGSALSGARDWVTDQLQKSREQRVEAEEQLRDLALAQAKAYDSERSIDYERLQLKGQFVEQQEKLLAITKDQRLTAEQRDNARALLANLPDAEAAALRQLQRDFDERNRKLPAGGFASESNFSIRGVGGNALETTFKAQEKNTAATAKASEKLVGLLDKLLRAVERGQGIPEPFLSGR